MPDEARLQRSMVLLNEMGDVEISWDSQDDDKMRQVIDKKMKEGVRFFILKPMLGGLLNRKTELHNLADLEKYRINVADQDIEKMFTDGTVRFHRRGDSGHIEVERAAKSPEEAAASQTVGVKQFKGG